MRSVDIVDFLRFVFVNSHSGAKKLHGSLLSIELFTHINKIVFLRARNKKVKEIITKHKKNRGKRNTSRTHETLANENMR